jgi:hypothetical protein
MVPAPPRRPIARPTGSRPRASAREGKLASYSKRSWPGAACPGGRRPVAHVRRRPSAHRGPAHREAARRAGDRRRAEPVRGCGNGGRFVPAEAIRVAAMAAALARSDCTTSLGYVASQQEIAFPAGELLTLAGAYRDERITLASLAQQLRSRYERCDCLTIAHSSGQHHGQGTSRFTACRCRPRRARRDPAVEGSEASSGWPSTDHGNVQSLRSGHR